MRVPVARVHLLLVLAAAIGALGLCTASSGAAASAGDSEIAALRSKIDHVIVIYQENWSFDGLYAKFPGANGDSSVGTPQLQCPTGTASYVPMTGLPPALIVAGRPTGPWPCGWQGLAGGVQDTNVPLGMPMKPYALTAYEPPTNLTGDLWHIFWHEQLQIDNGLLEPSAGRPMDKFAAYSSNPGLSFSQYDASNMPEGKPRATLHDGGQLLPQRVRRIVPQPPILDLRLRTAVAAAAARKLEDVRHRVERGDENPQRFKRHDAAAAGRLQRAAVRREHDLLGECPAPGERPEGSAARPDLAGPEDHRRPPHGP